MVEKGLIEKEMSPQTKYSIVPPDVVLPLLVTRKQSQISKLKLEAQTVMGKLGTAQKDIFRNQDAHFMVVTGRNLIIERLKKTLSKTQISVETVTTQKRFQNAILEFAELYRQALERGVKIRLATEEQVLTKETLRILAMLGKYRNFEVRFFPERIPAITAVFDGKEVHICLSITAPLSGAEGLWSNNSCFVAIAKNYFETTWAKCSKLDLSKLAF
jgi:sugar-specific transcriptional regulator TrmB